MKICKNCNTIAEENNKYCPICGLQKFDTALTQIEHIEDESISKIDMIFKCAFMSIYKPRFLFKNYVDKISTSQGIMMILVMSVFFTIILTVWKNIFVQKYNMSYHEYFNRTSPELSLNIQNPFLSIVTVFLIQVTLLLIFWFFVILVVHIFMIILGKKSNNFNASLKVVALSSGILILSVIPYSFFIIPTWWNVIIIIAMRSYYKISWIRSIIGGLVLFTTYYACCFLGLAINFLR